MSQINVNTITNRDKTGGPNLVGITTVTGNFNVTDNFNVTGVSTISGLTYPTAGPLSNRNKIINGDMRIDQRNAGASVTAVTNTAQLDRWKTFFTGNGVFTVQQSNTVPNNTFSKSVVLTVTTDDSSISSGEDYGYVQFIEGYNIADFAWGSASATDITLSFWVRSSVDGTWVASIYNSDGTRCYPATFSISAADTWQKISLTIPGDTGGTWNSTNGTGMVVRIDLGSGSNFNGTANSWNTAGGYVGLRIPGSVNWISNSGATFYLTGVQLEAGTVATPFEHRNYGDELARCERYYAKTFNSDVAPAQNAGVSGALGASASVTGMPVAAVWCLPVRMKSTPSVITTYNPIAANANWSPNPGTPTVAVSNSSETSITVFGLTNTTAGNSHYIHMTADAEL
jgi:hypothetical protein